LEVKAQLITGYKGSSDFVVGAIRGDGDAVIAPVTSIRPMQQSRTVRILATFEPHSSFPGVPDATTLGKPELSRILLDRLVGAPPGLSTGIKNILSAAFAKSMADPRTDGRSCEEVRSGVGSEFTRSGRVPGSRERGILCDVEKVSELKRGSTKQHRCCICGWVESKACCRRESSSSLPSAW
jgi:hypothetical protein